MKLTLGQVRGALQLSQDAYRHWKTVLAPLAGRNGHKPSFSHGDLFALAIIKALTDDVGVPVGNLNSAALALFASCDNQPWAKFERLVALVQPKSGALSFVSDGQPLQEAQVMISIPCGPIISALRSALMMDQPQEPQGSFRFPLSAVADRRNVEGEKS